MPFLMTKCGGLLKSTVDCPTMVNAPKEASVPSPVKFWVKMPGVPVGSQGACAVKIAGEFGGAQGNNQSRKQRNDSAQS